MSLKLALVTALVAVTLARPEGEPDSPIGYDYAAPDETYATPTETYSAPVKPAPTYSAPAPAYRAPAPSYRAPARPTPRRSYGTPDETGHAMYDTQYDVRDDATGTNFGQQESRNGPETQGSYYVALPDGRLQTVTYFVSGDSGYVAEVTYEGEPQYPPANQYEYKAPTHSLTG